MRMGGQFLLKMGGRNEEVSIYGFIAESDVGDGAAMSVNHDLKIWPQFYRRVADGTKTFEVRVNDRGFQLGDTVVLREWDPDLVRHAHGPHDDREYDGYTRSRPLTFTVGYVLPIDAERVVFSLLSVSK